MNWRYQLTKETVDGHEQFAVREVYFDDDGKVSWTQDPIQIVGDSEQDITETLIRIRTDVKRGGVLDISSTQ